ncbi:DUF3800 domain-containing protein [Nonomuraea guangzhouensis]|uniref:DUF3800 domain-containing protein n=1 Tax=Nonomuraea guangzhouensis TaxID=1291555 RepID=A0ABW4GN89_9ACTN|nr:DUF3800 domain-containing protein [Nonomuraea guangzhouensis]
MTQPFEIACDESGSEGEKLIGGNTVVFAHASIRLDIESAADCIQEVRNRAPSPTTEYKSGVIRRKKHLNALKWLLGPSSPLHGNAHVYLIDKTFFAISRFIDLLADQDSRAMAGTLYREGEHTFGPDRWNAFLESFNDLMRTKNGRGPGASVDSVFKRIDTLRRAAPRSRAGEIMNLLWESRSDIDSFRARLPTLNPLFPAIIQAAVYWGEAGKPVSVVHDRQTLLTQERIDELKETRAAEGRLAGLRLVDSRLDPRIQVADLLAGPARKIAEDELTHQGDAELTALLRPYVDAFSVWGDDRSWSLLAPPTRGWAAPAVG